MPCSCAWHLKSTPMQLSILTSETSAQIPHAEHGNQTSIVIETPTGRFNEKTQIPHLYRQQKQFPNSCDMHWPCATPCQTLLLAMTNSSVANYMRSVNSNAGGIGRFRRQVDLRCEK